MQVSIIGGTGFIGSYVVDQLLAQGHRPKLLVRRGHEHKIERRAECATVIGDVSDKAAIGECMEGSDALIYLIGILREFPGRGVTFEALQYQGFADSCEAARKAGIRRVLLMSANGVEHDAVPYQQTKLRAEQLLQSTDFDWTIFRPSVVFGDPRGRMEFCTQLKRQLIDPPLPASVFFPGLNLPAAGGQPMSPVHVENVAQAFVSSLDNADSFHKVLPLGGPRTLSWKQIIQTIARATGKKGKLTAPAPDWGIKLVARALQGFEWFPLTADQVTMLMQGNAVQDHEAFDLLGIEPIPFNEEQLVYLRDA